jgi:hypothetical protein
MQARLNDRVMLLAYPLPRVLASHFGKLFLQRELAVLPCLKLLQEP